MGTLPHFPQHSSPRLGLALILASLTIIPLAETSPRPVQATNPTFSATIANYAFKPQHINVATGTPVIWTNNDGVQHTVTSSPQTNVTQGGSPLISSGSLNTRQSFTYTFYKHGFYPYQCNFHPYMTGWINVTGSDVQPPSSPPMTTSSTDYTPYIIGGTIAGAILTASLALFFRRSTRRAKST